MASSADLMQLLALATGTSHMSQWIAAPVIRVTPYVRLHSDSASYNVIQGECGVVAGDAWTRRRTSGMRIALFGQSDIFLCGLRMQLRNLGYEVVHESTDCKPFLHHLGRLLCDAVFIGPHVSEPHAFRICRLITDAFPNMCVVLYRCDASDSLVQVDAHDAGASACFSVTSDSRKQLDDLSQICSGRVRDREGVTLCGLTAREQSVLEHMAARMSYAEIAAKLGLSHTSIRNYAQRIIESLHTSNRHEAVRRARRRGMV